MLAKSSYFWLAALMACSVASKKKLPEERVDDSGRSRPRVDINMEAENLLNDFEKAVLKQDTSGVLGFLDPHYRDKEFSELFQSREGPFLNEFFCGKVVKGNQIYCLVFSEIQDIKRVRIEAISNAFVAHYTIKSAAHEIETQVTVTVEKTYHFGIVGSKGYTQVE